MSFFDPTSNQGNRSIAQLLNYCSKLRFFRFYPPRKSLLGREEFACDLKPNKGVFVGGELLEKIKREIEQIFQECYYVYISSNSVPGSGLVALGVYLNDISKVDELSESSFLKLPALESTIEELAIRYNLTISPPKDWKERAFDPDRWK
jgi:hypothetical protein